MLSFQGGIRVASYTASKSGIAGLTRLLANEWAAKGINVNAIAPGYFATNNTEALRADETRSARNPGAHSGRPLGPAGRSRRRGGVPGVARVGLCPRHDHAGRRRLARALAQAWTCCAEAALFTNFDFLVMRHLVGGRISELVSSCYRCHTGAGRD